MSNNNLQPHRPAPPPPSNPPTSSDLLKTMHQSLGDDKLYRIYFQHWELFQRGHINREIFDSGVAERYNLLNTPELLVLHARIANIPVQWPEPYTKEEYLQMMAACYVVFMNGDWGIDRLMKAHAEVITRMRNERGKRGLLEEL